MWEGLHIRKNFNPSETKSHPHFNRMRLNLEKSQGDITTELVSNTKVFGCLARYRGVIREAYHTGTL